MAVRDIDCTLSSKAFLTSPQVALYAVAGEKVEGAPHTSSKGLLSKMAPLLNAAEGQKVSDYLSQLAVYMNEVLLTLTSLSGKQSDIVNSEVNLSKEMVQLTQQEATEATNEANKILKEIHEEEHRSFWQKIGTAIGSALLCIAGVITGNPGLALSGAFLMTFTLSGLSDKLTSAISKFSPAVQGLILLGVAIGTAGVLSAASGGMTAALTEDAAVGAENGTSFLSRALKEGFTGGRFVGGNFVGMTLQTAGAINPFGPLTEALIKVLKPSISKNKEALIGEVMGCAIGILGMFAGAAVMETPDAAALTNVMKARIGEKALDQIDTVITGARALATGFSSVYGILQGKAMLDQASTEKAIGKTQSNLIIYQSIVQSMSDTTSQSQRAFQGIASQFSMINQRWDSFVEPYRHAVEVMG